MRIALGCFSQESNTFSPVHGSWEHLRTNEFLRGRSLLEEFEGTKTELGGVIDYAHGRGTEVVPLLSARAVASAGPMLREVFESIRDQLRACFSEVQKVDGVLLVLHGATVAVGYEDASGEILRCAREQVGSSVPIVATLDLHANVTATMVDHATALVGYHTYPHVDMHETGERGMHLLCETIGGKVRPTSALRRIPMILPPENGRTEEGPFSEVMTHADNLQKDENVLDISVFSVQPWLDVYDVGCSVVVVTNGDSSLAQSYADFLADEFWKRRKEFAVHPVSIVSAIESALSRTRHPIILSDSADAPSSGAPGDSTAILRVLLSTKPTKDCYLNIVDAYAVEQMIQAGVGKEITVFVGARLAPQFYEPALVTGEIKLISDGEFVEKGPGAHGVTYHRGNTAVIRIGHIFLVVSERPVYQWDPEFYRSLGLEPSDAQIVVVKSPSAFRAAYAPIAADIIVVDAPGVCSSNLQSLAFRRVGHPLYPLDDFDEWRKAR